VSTSAGTLIQIVACPAAIARRARARRLPRALALSRAIESLETLGAIEAGGTMPRPLHSNRVARSDELDLVAGRDPVTSGNRPRDRDLSLARYPSQRITVPMTSVLQLSYSPATS
jgi:hypothetical protein